MVIGRDAELAGVERLLGLIDSGRAGLLVQGDPGIGKTVFLAEATRRALESGFRVLRCRASEGEAQFGLAGLSDLLAEEAEAALALLPAPQASALAVALLRKPPERRRPLPREIGVAFLSALRALSRTSRCLLVVDDLQWLDRTTARIVGFALRRLENEPVGLIASTRHDHELPEWVREGVVEGWIESMVLHGLSLAALNVILREHLDVRLPRPLLSRVARASGGNPFFALELVRTTLQGRAHSELRVPRNLRGLVAERLARLDHDARQAVLVTFALSRPTPELVAAALGSKDGVDRAVAEGALVQAGDAVALSHPLLGSVLDAELTAQERCDLHARLAELPLDPEETARHVAICASAPDSQIADVLETAAARARARGALEVGAELLASAVRLTPRGDEPSRVRRELALALDEYTCGDAELGRRRWRALAAHPWPSVRAEALWHLAEFHDKRTIAGNLRLLEQALEESPVEPGLRAQIHSVYAEISLWAGRPRTAEAHAATAMALAERNLFGTQLAAILTVSALVDFHRGRGVRDDLLDRAASLEDSGEELPPVESTSRFYRSILVFWAGDDLEDARARLEEVLAVAEDRGDDVSLPLILEQLAELACAAGRVDDAAALVADAERAESATDAPHLRGLIRYALALVQAYSGRLEDARASALESLSLDESRGVLVQSARPRALLGLLALVEDRPDEALEWLSPLQLAITESGHEEPGLNRFLLDQAEALVRLGRIDEAEALLGPFERAAQRLGRLWASAAASRVRGLIAAARGQIQEALSVLEASAGRQEQLGQTVEMGRSLLALAAVQRRARRKADAAATLERAATLFQSMGAQFFADRALAELGRLAVRRPPSAALTPTQRRIAELAARGQTNREIAAAVFSSVKTVEANLTRVYRKLGLRSRSQLAAWLAAETRDLR